MWLLDPPFALATFCQPALGCHLVENFTSTRLECSGALDDRCETNPPIYFGLAIREINTLTKLIGDTLNVIYLLFLDVMIQSDKGLLYTLNDTIVPNLVLLCFFHYSQKQLANTNITMNETS